MANTLADVIAKQFGVKTFTRLNPDASSVGLTAARILGNTPNRLAFIFVNLSANNIYLNPINPPTATNGVRVGANGGNLVVLFSEDFDLVGYEWLGLADGAGSSFLALEVISQDIRT